MKNKITCILAWSLLTMVSWFILYTLVFWFGLGLSNIIIVRSGDIIDHLSAVLGIISVAFCSLYAPYRLYREVSKGE